MPAKRTKAEEIADQVTQLHAEGLGRNAIARRLGCSPPTVTRAAELAGLRFDVTATAQAVESAQVHALQRREEHVRTLYLLGRAAASRLGKLLAADELDARALVALIGITSDKIARLEPAIDVQAAELEQSAQALEELMDAIRNSVDDDDEETALAALAPGATIASVLGPDALTPDQEQHP